MADMTNQGKCCPEPPVPMENLKVAQNNSTLNFVALSEALAAECKSLFYEAEKVERAARLALQLFFPIFERMARDSARAGDRQFTIDLPKRTPFYGEVAKSHPDIAPLLWIPVMFEMLKKDVGQHFSVLSGSWMEGTIQCVVTMNL